MDSEVRRLYAPSKLSVSLSQATERLWTACCGPTSELKNDVVVSDSTSEDADGAYVDRRCDTEKELQMPTMESAYSLDNNSGPDESSESEYESSSDDQADCNSQQSVDEPGMTPNHMVQVYIEC